MVVKRLISIEDLGNIEVLFTDKTGTLTEGRISFQEALDPAGRHSSHVFLDLALLCAQGAGSNLAASGNALDQALVQAGKPMAGCETLDRLPFDHERRLMSTLVVGPDSRRLLVTKGAPESLLARCGALPAGAQETVDGLFAAGARVIAVASRPWSGAARCTRPSGRTRPGTGRFPHVTATPQGRRSGLAGPSTSGWGGGQKAGDGRQRAGGPGAHPSLGLRLREAITGPELERLSDQELRERLPRTGVFARVSPEQKSRIILAERASGRDVGFLGDRVNDAVACATMTSASPSTPAAGVAKDAADIVLLGKDLGILAGGVLEGRRIFSNTMKYVLMGTSSNFGNMFSAAGGSLILNFLPMTPTQILLNNLLYDTGEMTIPSDQVDPEMLERPAQWDIRLIRRFMLFFGPISSVFDFLTFGVMLFVFHARGSLFQPAWFRVAGHAEPGYLCDHAPPDARFFKPARPAPDRGHGGQRGKSWSCRSPQGGFHQKLRRCRSVSWRSWAGWSSSTSRLSSWASRSSSAARARRFCLSAPGATHPPAGGSSG